MVMGEQYEDRHQLCASAPATAKCKQNVISYQVNNVRTLKIHCHPWNQRTCIAPNLEHLLHKILDIKVVLVEWRTTGSHRPSTYATTTTMTGMSGLAGKGAKWIWECFRGGRTIVSVVLLWTTWAVARYSTLPLRPCIFWFSFKIPTRCLLIENDLCLLLSLSRRKEMLLISTQNWWWWQIEWEKKVNVIACNMSYPTLLCQQLWKTKREFMKLWNDRHPYDQQWLLSNEPGPSWNGEIATRVDGRSNSDTDTIMIFTLQTKATVI